MTRTIFRPLFLAFLGLAPLAGLRAAATPTERSTFLPSFTDTPTKTETNTFTASPTRTPTPTRTGTRTMTGTRTETGTVTQTFTVSPTFSASPTHTQTFTRTGTRTETPTFTITNTFTDSPTISATLTPWVKPSLTATPDLSSTPTFTASPTATPSMTQTFTPGYGSFTSTNTFTPTATPGSGSYSFYLQDLQGTGPARAIKLGPAAVTGGNILYIGYTVGTYVWSEGLLSFYFPPGFEAPSPNNFRVVPQWDWTLWPAPGATPAPAYPDNYEFAPAPTLTPIPGATPYVTPEYQGGTVTVQVGGMYPGLVLSFEYGGINGVGFSYNGTGVTASVQVWSNPVFYPVPGAPIPTPAPGLWATGTPPPTPYLGGLVRAPAPMAVASMQASKTQTKTFTITQTFTASPTISSTPSDTPTVTPTPAIGPERHVFYCYPNPYDRRLRSDLTFRFDEPKPSGMVVFNLLGNPVAHIPLSNFLLNGFQTYIPGFGGGPGAPGGQAAQWNGKDDYGEEVAGGLYFAVLKGPNGTQVLKFTILN